MTNGALVLVSIGNKLIDTRKQFFWSPCAVDCLDLVFEDIGGITIIHNTIGKTKRITSFIYRHSAKFV